MNQEAIENKILDLVDKIECAESNEELSRLDKELDDWNKILEEMEPCNARS